MKRIGLILVAAAAIIPFSPAAAQSTRSWAIGIAGGASLPMGNFSDDVDTGYHGSAFYMADVGRGLPMALRLEGAYSRFGARGDRFFQPDVATRAATLNLVYAVPGTAVRPYLIGGAGVYWYQEIGTGRQTESEVGLNGGIGASFPLSGFSTFVEARYHRIDVGQGISFLPLTFGISF